MDIPRPPERSNLIDWVHDKRIESLVCPRRELPLTTPDLWACHGGITHTANEVARATRYSSADLMRPALAVRDECRRPFTPAQTFVDPD